MPWQSKVHIKRYVILNEVKNLDFVFPAGMRTAGKNFGSNLKISLKILAKPVAGGYDTTYRIGVVYDFDAHNTEQPC